MYEGLTLLLGSQGWDAGRAHQREGELVGVESPPHQGRCLLDTLSWGAGGWEKG